MSADDREALVRYYRWLRHYGLNDSHSGNASVRDGERVWTTPTGCCADTLEVGDLVESPLDGEIGAGASLDAPLHLAVYRANPRARAVLHSHCPYAVAMTLDGSDFEPADFEGRLYFERVPVLRIPYAEYVERAPAAVARALEDSPVAVVCGHGVYAWGESLDQAYKWTNSLELSAKTTLLGGMAAGLGSPHAPRP